MGKQRGKFEMGFKQQIIQDVEWALLSASSASRNYQNSASVLDRWRQQAKQGVDSIRKPRYLVTQ